MSESKYWMGRDAYKVEVMGEVVGQWHRGAKMMRLWVLLIAVETGGTPVTPGGTIAAWGRGHRLWVKRSRDPRASLRWIFAYEVIPPELLPWSAWRARGWCSVPMLIVL